MNFETNKIYHGFELLKAYPVKETDSLARVFLHKKSGARLLHLENDDDNKVFSIAFRTPPSDHTGVPHIVEHCVLSGSRKYHTKEPFMDMVKGSLNTFINAMTFDDKTMYPVSSKNNKDFENLMDVYLDAVFYPKINEIPEIFLQEGWCYDIDAPEDTLKYNGVVYNEMLGAYSDPSTILADKINASLFPNTCYRFSSGGNPEFVPNLTFENFNNFHKKYYHPSNSYIYLYGNGDLDKQLQHINDEYLCNFEATEIDSKIPIENAFESPTELISEYNLAANEDSENKSYLSKSYVLGLSQDAEMYYANSVLEKILITSTSGILKKALLDAGIGEDIFSLLSEGQQPYLSIVAKNTSADNKDSFNKILNDTLVKIVDNGLDENHILSCINMIEFIARENQDFHTKGIVYGITALSGWIYDGDETSHLEFNKILDKFKSEAKNGYFENLIKTYLLNNNHASTVILNGSEGLADRQAAKCAEKLQSIKDSYSEDELLNLITSVKALKTRQLSPDTPEAIATLPKLDVSDVNRSVEKIPQEVFTEKDATLLFHDIFTNNISYVNLIFDTTWLSLEKMKYLNLLCDLIGKLDTNTMSYSDLSNSIYTKTGGISLSAGIYSVQQDCDDFVCKLNVQGKSIQSNITDMMSLMNTLMLETKFSDKSRIKELIKQLKSRIEMDLYGNGITVMNSRVSSYFSISSYYSENIRGLEFFWFLSELLENFDENSEKILSTLTEIYSEVFNLENITLSFTGDKESFELFKANYNTALSSLTSVKKKIPEIKFNCIQKNEGISSASNVQYVAKGFNFKKLGYDFHGSMKVLETILNGEFLHDRVRAKGGAYGCYSSFSMSGNLVIVSYRDPNLSETLDVYNTIADYLDELSMDQETITKFIIGTLSSLDGAETPHGKGSTAESYYITKTSYDVIQKMRDELLDTTVEDIKSLAKIVREVMDKNYISVLGNSNKIQDNKDLFNELKDLM